MHWDPAQFTSRLQASGCTHAGHFVERTRVCRPAQPPRIVLWYIMKAHCGFGAPKMARRPPKTADPRALCRGRRSSWMVAPCFNKQNLSCYPSHRSSCPLAWPCAGMPPTVQHQCIVCACLSCLPKSPPTPRPTTGTHKASPPSSTHPIKKASSTS